MEPNQPFLPKNTDYYQPLNGSATNGASHSSDEQGITLDNSKAMKSRIVKRLNELEQQNDGLRSILEERKNEIAEIISANKKYISVLAHDLKSPFSTIYGVLGILKDCIHEGNYDQMEGYIDIASSSSLSTTNLIENILAWVQSQSPEKRFNPISVSLAKLVKQEIENSYLAVKLKKISLSHSIPESFLVLVDIQMTQSIIRNLISNALKFTDTGGTITISAKDGGPFIEVMVIDDGIGISPKNQQEIFRKGPSELVSGNGNVRSKGLGLMLCKDFVEAHGGSIWVESQQGLGSSFHFTLPKYLL